MKVRIYFNKTTQKAENIGLTAVYIFVCRCFRFFSFTLDRELNICGDGHCSTS